MQRLSQTDCGRLLALTGELYSIASADQLPQHLLQSLPSLIPYEFGGCHLISPARHQIAPCYRPERPPLPARHKEFWRLTESHPLNPVLFAKPARAWKLTDVISRRAFHATEFYNVLYRPLQVDCELAAVLPEDDLSGTFFLVSLHRRGSDFTERDRAILNLLLPQVAQARRRFAADPPAGLNGCGWFSSEGTFYEWVCARTRWGLTRRESEVLFWLCQGKTNAEIGRILGMAGRTAETHALRIYPKMGVENRYNAIAAMSQLTALQRP